MAEAAPAVAPVAPAPAPKPISQDQRGVPDPVRRIQAILNAEVEDRQEPPAAPPGADEQAALPEAQPEGDVPAGPNAQVEGDPVGDDQPGIPLDQLEAIELDVTVKGEDGKDIAEKQTVKGLRDGYMRQKDYQRKTAELARQREEVGNQIRQAVEGERNAYTESLQQMQQLFFETVAPELKDVNWNDLAANNAFEFVRLTNRKDQITQALSKIQENQRFMTERQRNEQAAARTKLADKAREVLQTDIPGWNDDLYQTLMKSGAKHGYKPEDVATWVDPRAIKLLHKAHLYDQLQAGKTQPAPDKRVVVPPKVLRPGAVQESNTGRQQAQSALKRLQTTGKLEDAAAVIRSRLG